MNSEVSAKEVSNPSGVGGELDVADQFPTHVTQAVIADKLSYFVEFYFRFKIFGINHIELKIEKYKIENYLFEIMNLCVIP